MIDSYQRVVVRKNGKYFVSIPELGLVVSDGNLNDAWSMIEKRIQKDYQAFAEADLSDEFPRPRKAERNSAEQASALKGFLVRVGGVTVGAMMFVLVSVYGINIMIKTNVESTIQKVKVELEGAEIDWPRLRRNIIRTSDPSKALPEAEKQSLIDALDTLALRYQPYVGAFMKLSPDSNADPKPEDKN